MLKLSDLALRPDMQLGPMLVSPSRRLVEGPGGQVHLEPLIMQVFLLLLDARGRVVTRGELFDQCWGGVSVGDDSLNHAIVKVRRTGAQVVPGFFEIETIPRTGYRLTGDILQVEGHSDVPATRMRRRAVIGSGLAVAAVGGSAGLWWANRPRFDPRFDALIERGQNALRLDENAAEYFRQAATLQPENAKAWGLLAYAIGSGRDSGPTAVPGPTAQLAERAARTALKLDPNEPNALLAMTFIQSVMLDWISRENEYRRILAIDPANTLAMRHLGVALHAVGRCRDSLEIVERALAIEPLTPDHQLRRAMRLWVLGRVTEADRTSDRAMQLWPSHRLVRLARLMIYAFTGRTRAALAIVEEEEKHPILLMPGATGLWRVSLAALENPTSERVASARSANLDGAQANPAMAAWAILMLSALGELDGAFEVANGFLLSRGPAVLQPSSVSKSERPISIPGWRNTFGLFTPPTKAMRLDKRFGALADGLGLTDYWKRRGIGPDDFLFKP
ncbi:MAG TPA: winged helix-turn-helix domain-containing protein [Sphingomicrobium sp.]|nr:winged helix-turn-helix domain-containing protein [Sphingomicrobium sp.]